MSTDTPKLPSNHVLSVDVVGFDSLRVNYADNTYQLFDQNPPSAWLVSQLASVTEERDRLKRELEERKVEALDLSGHIGNDIPVELIVTAHSWFPANPSGAFPNGYAAGHRPYHQGRDGAEACYICTLLALYDVTKQDATRAEQQLAASREAVQLIQAARELVDETNWVRGMRNDDPNKGSGNRLADALDKYDRALSASAAKEGA